MLDPSDPVNWAASLNEQPTPGFPNSVLDSSNRLRLLDAVVQPEAPTPGDPIVISVEASTDVLSVQLYYRIGMESQEVGPIDMVSTVVGSWEATLPAQSAGSLPDTKR